MTALGRRSAPGALEVRLARHPEVGGAVLAGVAWLVLAIQHWSNHAAAPGPWSFSLGEWTLMCGAMMMPAVLPAMRRVGFVSLRSRRHRSPLVFVSAYVAVWAGFGLLAAALVTGVESMAASTFNPGPVVKVGALLLAAGWQLTPVKQSFLDRRHQDRPLAARGWKATWNLLTFGAQHGRTCVGSCWAIMGAMFVVGHDLHLMVPLAVITTVERWQRQPNPAVGAAALVAMAIGLTATSLI